jgi:hypothetical protein
MLSSRRAPAALLLLGLLGACGGAPAQDAGGGDEDAIGAGEGFDTVDPRFQVTLDKRWLMKGDGLTAPDRTLTVRVTPPTPQTQVRGAIDEGPVLPAAKQSDGRLAITFPVDALQPGEHTVLLATRGQRKPFATLQFQVTFPLYVVVSTDFDDTRFSDREIARIEKLRQDHPKLVYSHFFAPFHYTDPEVSAARKIEIETWVKKMRDTSGDELGVHIHCWCHFVTAAGVTCHPQPSFAPNDDSGYVTILASYSVDEMRAMLRYAVKLFADHGLGRPTSFRAGGWTADLGTLQALESEGFLVDSSALPTQRIEEWKGFGDPTNGLFSWNLRNWAGIDEKSQPYFPARDKLVSPSTPTGLGVLEVPDNGVLVDYVSGREMIDIFEMNLPGGKPLGKSTLYQVGFHPPNFSDRFLGRMQEALANVDEHLYSADKGPAVYVKISELAKVWRR